MNKHHNYFEDNQGIVPPIVREKTILTEEDKEFIRLVPSSIHSHYVNSNESNRKKMRESFGYPYSASIPVTQEVDGIFTKSVDSIAFRIAELKMSCVFADGPNLGYDLSNRNGQLYVLVLDALAELKPERRRKIESKLSDMLSSIG